MTDPRLEAALKGAAECHFPYNEPANVYLAGWAEAVRLLQCWHQESYEERNDGASIIDPAIMHAGICGDETTCEPCKPCQAIRRFCTTMLGEEAES